MNLGSGPLAAHSFFLLKTPYVRRAVLRCRSVASRLLEARTSVGDSPSQHESEEFRRLTSRRSAFVRIKQRVGRYVGG